MTAEPIPTMVKRYKCPHCNLHLSVKKKAVEHVARCWLDPAKRACRTCKFHRRAYYSAPTDWCEPGRRCGCNDMDEHCAAGAEPEAFPVVDCPLWELAERLQARTGSAE
jgi:transcription elongation factor Elf1